MATQELKTRGLSVQELAVEVQRRTETMEDFISDTRRIGFVTDPEPESGTDIVLSLDNPDDGDQLDLAANEHCQHQIASRLQVPFKFWERMRDNHPDILEDTVSKLFVREPEVRMIRAVDGYARAFLSNRYRRLDYWDLMERSILPALSEDAGMQVFSCGLTDLRLYMKIIFPEIRVEIRPGDEVSCGLIIGNSEVGAGSLFAEPFTYTWACSNGTIFGQKQYGDFGLRKYHVGKEIEDTDEARAIFTDETLRKEDEAFFAKAYDVVKNARNGIQFAAIADRMRELAGIKMKGDHVAAVERLAKTYTLRESEKTSVMQHLIEGGDLTAYGYINAITRMAQDVDNYDRATELERLAGGLSDLSAKRWQALTEA